MLVMYLQLHSLKLYINSALLLEREMQSCSPGMRTKQESQDFPGSGIQNGRANTMLEASAQNSVQNFGPKITYLLHIIIIKIPFHSSNCQMPSTTCSELFNTALLDPVKKIGFQPKNRSQGLKKLLSKLPLKSKLALAHNVQKLRHCNYVTHIITINKKNKLPNLSLTTRFTKSIKITVSEFHLLCPTNIPLVTLTINCFPKAGAGCYILFCY